MVNERGSSGKDRGPSGRVTEEMEKANKDDDSQKDSETTGASNATHMPNGDAERKTSSGDGREETQRSSNSSSSPGPAENNIILSVNRPVLTQPVFDEYHSAGTRPSKTVRERCRSLRNRCECSGRCVKKRILALLPFISIMKNYSLKKDFLYDLIAGLTISVVHIPQGMAYAMLANVDPVYGLYTSFFGVILYYFFSTSRHISVGVSVAASLMVGSAVDSQCGADQEPAASVSGPMASATTLNPGQLVDFTGTYPDLFNETINDAGSKDCNIIAATTVTFISGVVQLVLGFSHMGSVVVFMSEPMTRGFTTGAAVHVLASQLKHIFGIKIGRYNGLWKLYYTYRDLFQEIHNTNTTALIISIICFIALWVTKVYINPRVKQHTKAPIPMELIVVILVVIGSYYGHWEDKYDLAVVGHIPKGLPEPVFPALSNWSSLIGDGIATALVTFAVSVSVAQVFADKHNYKIDANQELVAHGVCSVVGVNFRCIVASASMSRSVVLESLGNHTQLSGIVASGVLFLVLMWLAPLLEPLPNCVLGAIVLVALKGLFMQFTDLQKLWKVSKVDLSVWLFAFTAVVLSDMAWGLAGAMLFAMITVIARTQSPYCCLEGRVSDTDIYKDVKVYKAADEIPGVKVFRFEASLYFANSRYFQRRLYRKTGCHPKKLLIAQRKVDSKKAKAETMQKKYDKELETSIQKRKTPPSSNVLDRIAVLQELKRPIPDIHHIIIDCTTMAYVDSQGVSYLNTIVKDYKAIKVKVLLAGCKAAVRETLEQGGFYEKADRSTMYPTVHDAVLAALQDYPEALRQLQYVPRLESPGSPADAGNNDTEDDESESDDNDANATEEPVQVVVSNGRIPQDVTKF